MRHLEQVKAILHASLGLGKQKLEPDTPLLGSLPELDSMAVLGLIAALEHHFNIAVDDDEIHARHFATVASLTGFVNAKLAP